MTTTTMHDAVPECVRLTEVAARLGLHVATLRRRVRRGELVALRFGGVLLIPTAAVERLVTEATAAAREEGSSAAAASMAAARAHLRQPAGKTDMTVMDRRR